MVDPPAAPDDGPDIPGRPPSGIELGQRDAFGDFLNRLDLLGVGAEVGVQEGAFSRRILEEWRGRLLYLDVIDGNCGAGAGHGGTSGESRHPG